MVGIDNVEFYYFYVDFWGKSGGFIVCFGLFGWSCIGVVDENKVERMWIYVICVLFIKEFVWSDEREICCDIDNSFKRFWEIEKFGIECIDRFVFIEEEWLVLNKVIDFLKYEKGRYCVVVFWKDEKFEFFDIKLMVLFCFRSIERNLKKDDCVVEDYKKII